MRYCPICRIDYDDEVEECFDCGGPLVEGSSREIYDDVSDDDWVELDPLPSIAAAKTVMDVLDEELIPCYIEAFFGGSGLDGYSATIMVPDNFFDSGLEIQQGIAPPDQDSDLLIDPDADDF